MITVKELVRFREQLNDDSIEEETAAIIGYIYAHEKAFKMQNEICCDCKEIDEDIYRRLYVEGWIDGIEHKPSHYSAGIAQRKMLDSMLTGHLKPIQPVEPVNPDYPGEEIAKEQLKNKGGY